MITQMSLVLLNYNFIIYIYKSISCLYIYSRTPVEQPGGLAQLTKSLYGCPDNNVFSPVFIFSCKNTALNLPAKTHSYLDLWCVFLRGEERTTVTSRGAAVLRVTVFCTTWLSRQARALSAAAQKAKSTKLSSVVITRAMLWPCPGVFSILEVYI